MLSTVLLKKYHDGYDVVYGVRSSRAKDTWFKKKYSIGIYRFQEKMGVNSVYNHADYRLMSKRALEALSQFKEVNLFLRGLVPLVGFDSCIVEYERNERFAGESKYPLKKMLSFCMGWNHIIQYKANTICNFDRNYNIRS